MNGTPWVEHLAEKDRAVYAQRQHQAALNVIALLGYPSPDDPDLVAVLSMLGLIAYDAPLWQRVHGSKVRRDAV